MFPFETPEKNPTFRNPDAGFLISRRSLVVGLTTDLVKASHPILMTSPARAEEVLRLPGSVPQESAYPLKIFFL